LRNGGDLVFVVGLLFDIGADLSFEVSVLRP
jgi:hypothetical protein